MRNIGLPPLSTMIMIVLTALLIGHFAGAYITDNNVNEVLESNQKALDNQKEILSFLRDNFNEEFVNATYKQYGESGHIYGNLSIINEKLDSLQLQIKGD